jgi:hypothetical protein
MSLAPLLLVGLLATTVVAGGGPTGPSSSTVVRVTQSGGLTPETQAAATEAAWITGAESTVLHRVTVRMLEVFRGDTTVQSAPAGYGYPMLTTAADPSAVALNLTVRRALARGEVVMGELAADIRGAREGDVARIEGLNGVVTDLVIGAVVPDQDLGWSEIWLSTSVGTMLGIDRPQAILLWGGNSGQTAVLVREFAADDTVRVSVSGRGRPSDLDPVLPVAVVKQRFGEFSVRPAAGDAVLVDPAWRDEWIVSVDFPLVGVTRCHRMVVPYIRGALAEVEALGLAQHLDRDDFQLAGGCWNARFNRGGDPGFSLSRHSWGTAIDFNPSTNRYGEEPTLPLEIVEVFRRWGFSWGGTWTVPDGMHFEWARLPSQYSVGCSSLVMTEGSQATAEAGWSIEPRAAGCP